MPIVILFLIGFFFGYMYAQTEIDQLPTDSHEWSLEDAADAYASKHGIDPALFRALIQAESAWNPDAVSPVGARGLTQVMPATAASDCGIDNPDDLFDPAVNLDCGASYLAKMLRLQDGDIALALASYNAGPGNAGRALKSFPETKKYVRRILADYEGE